MNDLKVGYAQVDINPPLGIGIGGYYKARYAKGYLDNLKASALAFQCGETQIVLISVDLLGVNKKYYGRYSSLIEEKTGLPQDHIFLSATHSHTAAMIEPTDRFPVDKDQINRYADFVGERLVDAVKLALADVKPGKMGYIVGYAPDRVAYIRRYKMKDGTTMTCPPINDPNIDHAIGELDQRVNVLRFDREGGASVVLVNYGLHADTTNGEMISADWPYWMRNTIEKALDGVQCIYFNGAEGDVGSTHVWPEGGDMNDTEISFDNEMKSPGMSRFVGRALAGTVLQVYDKACFVDVDEICIEKKLSR